MDTNKYAAALRAGRAGDRLSETLAPLANEEIASAEDAESIAEFLEAERRWLAESVQAPSRLQAVVGLFQQVDSREAYGVFARRGLPVLREIHDEWITRDTWSDEGKEAFLFLIKILALYANEEDLPRITQAARNQSLQEEYLWTPIFAVYHSEHPLYEAIFDELADPLPDGFAGVSLLDVANQRCREQGADHPFNSPSGHTRLETYMHHTGDLASSYAHSAAAALPFIDDPPRGRLLALGLDHADERVQLESAWASASIGSRAGVEFLARACLDWRQSSIAIEYLTELEELNAIPARAAEPEFAAQAEMARWLSHPMEFGRPPDEVAVLDRRTLHWPPVTGQRRDFWVVRFRYRGPDATDPGEIGVGLVGNITFALFGETNPSMDPNDIYALHCCWEMEVENVEGAPTERTIAAGRELLRAAGNAGF